MNLPAQAGEDLKQQRCGGNAIHVVISENDEGFVALARLEEPFHGAVHPGQQEGVGQVSQPRLEERGGEVRVAQAAIQEALGKEWGDTEAFGQFSGQERL